MLVPVGQVMVVMACVRVCGGRGSAFQSGPSEHIPPLVLATPSVTAAAPILQPGIDKGDTQRAKFCYGHAMKRVQESSKPPVDCAP